MRFLNFIKFFKYARKPDFKNMEELDYDKYWKNRGATLNSFLRDRDIIIFELINKNSKVADVGCGNSFLPVELLKKNCRVDCYDVSQIFFSEYNRYGIRTEKLDLNNIGDFNFFSNYDYIILSEVLEHIPGPELVIKKLLQHSKYFIITIPNSAFIVFRLSLLFRGRFFTQWVYHPSEHLRFWSHSDFKDWLRALGLEIVKTTSSNGIFFLKNLWPNMFGFQIVYLVKKRD